MQLSRRGVNLKSQIKNKIQIKNYNDQKFGKLKFYTWNLFAIWIL